MTINKEQSLIQTIIAVQGDINTKGFAKDLKNSQQNYAYRGIDPLYNLVSPILVKHGLIIIPTTQSYELMECGKTSNGATIFKAKVNMIYRMFHIHNDQHIVYEFPGEANDSADKATNKATTSSFKYMMIQVFKMPIVGSENDPDDGTPESFKEPIPKPVPKKVEKAPTIEEIQKLYEATKFKLPAEWIEKIDKHLANKDLEKLILVYNEIRKK